MTPQVKVSVASYFAERYGHEVDLLPNPPHKRATDVFNRTLGKEQEHKVNSKLTKSAIDNEVRSAAKHANDIVLHIDFGITFEDLRNGIRGRVNRCTNISSITIIKGNNDLTYTRKQFSKLALK